MPKPQLTLEDAQELVAAAAKALGLSRYPKVVTHCPWAPERKGLGKVVGAFHPLLPDVICVRDLNPATLLHEFGHAYYYWYVAPALGRYDEGESEMMARRFERLAGKVSFKCSVCGGAVLMKTERPVCGHCGAVYQAVPGDQLTRALLFGGIALVWASFFSAIAGGIRFTLPGKRGRATEAAMRMASPVLVGILTAAATKLTYDWAKERLGWT